MRALAVVTLLLGAAMADTKGIDFLPKAETAVEMARTRGKLVFLTVMVDHDAENRAVVEEVLADPKLRALLSDFACLLANPETQHGTLRVKLPNGKPALRCADAPSIECAHHVHLAQGYARGFYGDKPVMTPVHFVLDRNEEVLDMIFTGDFQGGMNRTSSAELVKRLEKLLTKHGKPLGEAEFKRMVDSLVEAKAARARGLFPGELKALLAVAALGRDVDGVREARARLKEVEGVAGAELEKAKALAAEKHWEEALDALSKVRETFPGTLTAAAAQQAENELRTVPEVKKFLQSRELFLAGKAFVEKSRPELARKKFEECVRRFAGTKYAELAKQELEKLPAAEAR